MSRGGAKTPKEAGPVEMIAGENVQTCGACGNIDECVTVNSARDQVTLAHVCGFCLARGMEALTGYKYVKYYAAMYAQAQLRKFPKRRERVVISGKES